MNYDDNRKIEIFTKGAIALKKFVSGIIVGALLFAGVSVAADGAGLIGKKVSGVYTIEKNGKLVAEAAIINGSAYAPVRAVAEAAGTELKVEGRKIIMSDSATQDSVTITNDVNGEANTDLQTDRETLVANIEKKKANITDLETNVIPLYEAQVKDLSTNGTLSQQVQGTVDSYKEILKQRKAELAELQQLLATLDAQIAAMK